MKAPSFEPLFDDEDLHGGATVKPKSKSKSKHSDEVRELFFAPRKRIVNKHREYRDWTWACDLFFPPRVGRDMTVFCAIELTSRLGFATLGDRTAASTVKSLNKLVKRVGADRVKHLNFDQGAEFNNAQVKAWVAKHCESDTSAEPARPWYYDSHSTGQKGTIESFNRTVRYALAIHAKTVNPYWDDSTLDEICADYNAKRHSGMRGATPNDAAGPSQDSALLRGLIRYKAQVDSAPYVKALNDFRPGDRVRVWVGADPKYSPVELEKMDFSKKAGQRWTDEVYVVDKVGSRSSSSASAPSSSAAGTTKAAGWYITLDGVGDGTAAGARRFSPQNLLKVFVDAPATAAKPAQVSASAHQGFKAAEARARKDGVVKRFLVRENLHEAAAEHAKKSSKEADAREALLRKGFADAEASSGIGKRTRASQAAAAAAAAAQTDEKGSKSKHARVTRSTAAAVVLPAPAPPAPAAAAAAAKAKVTSSTDSSLLAKAREGFKQFLSTKQGQAFRQAAARGLARSPRDLKLR